MTNPFRNKPNLFRICLGVAALLLLSGGSARAQERGCDSDKEMQAGLCYPKCKPGFSGIVTKCVQECPPGWRNDGFFCAKPAAYGRGTGYAIWNEAKCNRENPGGCEKWGLNWYPKCKAGFHPVGCCLCSPSCPQGMTDIGVSCQKSSYDRGIGKVPATVVPPVPVNVANQPFYNIAHMTNTQTALRWAIKEGANAVEIDLQYDAQGLPTQFQHKGICDCSCVPLGLAPENHVCSQLEPKGSRCEATESAMALLNVIAGTNLAMVYIDNKVDKNTPATAPGALVKALEQWLFDRGYRGIVVIGGTEATVEFLKAGAVAANASRFSDQIYFAMDQVNGGDAISAINTLATQVATRNRAYGAGLTSCAPGSFHKEIIYGAKNQGAHVTGLTYVWTLDSPATMQQYIDAGARGIMTNKPAVLRDLLASRGIRLADNTYRPLKSASNVAVK